jgi:hypothetical protein
MRLRITRQLHESIDGIQLSAFRPGYVYNVGTTVGNYLLAVRAAEPVADDHPFLVLPPERLLFYPRPPRSIAPLKKHPQRLTGVGRAEAADLERRSRGERKDGLSARHNERSASRLMARVAALSNKVERIRRQLERLLA